MPTDLICDYYENRSDPYSSKYVKGTQTMVAANAVKKHKLVCKSVGTKHLGLGRCMGDVMRHEDGSSGWPS